VTCDVMFSIHVKTMKETATLLKNVLQNYGIKVWMCTDMRVGESYRAEIVKAITSCKIFIPFINTEWALSGECEDEYNLAKRRNLTSHEEGRTTRSQSRQPIIFPIAFKGLDWNKYPHVQLLAANTNFVVHDDLSFLTGNVEKTVTEIHDAIESSKLFNHFVALGDIPLKSLLPKLSSSSENPLPISPPVQPSPPPQQERLNQSQKSNYPPTGYHSPQSYQSQQSNYPPTGYHSPQQTTAHNYPTATRGMNHGMNQGMGMGGMGGMGAMGGMGMMMQQQQDMMSGLMGGMGGMGGMGMGGMGGMGQMGNMGGMGQMGNMGQGGQFPNNQGFDQNGNMGQGGQFPNNQGFW